MKDLAGQETQPECLGRKGRVLTLPFKDHTHPSQIHNIGPVEMVEAFEDAPTPNLRTPRHLFRVQAGDKSIFASDNGVNLLDQFGGGDGASHNFQVLNVGIAV